MSGAVGRCPAQDLQIELRTLESVPAMTLFSVTTFVLFHFALDREHARRRPRRGIFG